MFKTSPNSYIGFNIYNNFISFNQGFDIIDNNIHPYTTLQIQKNGILYTNSKIECSEDHICNIAYNPYIIDKILKNIKSFFSNKINISYNEFNTLLNQYNIQFKKHIYYYKINNSTYAINLQDIFIY